jgi:hypothetical protein
MHFRDFKPRNLPHCVCAMLCVPVKPFIMMFCWRFLLFCCMKLLVWWCALIKPECRRRGGALVEKSFEPQKKVCTTLEQALCPLLLLCPLCGPTIFLHNWNKSGMLQKFFCYVSYIFHVIWIFLFTCHFLYAHNLDFFSPSTYNITIGNQILFHSPK